MRTTKIAGILLFPQHGRLARIGGARASGEYRRVIAISPIYGQVPIFTGADRGVIDLPRMDHTGGLVVIELKTTADRLAD